MKQFFLMGAGLIMASTIQAFIPPRLDTQLIHQKIDSLILEKDIIQFKSDFFSSLIYLNDSIGYYNPEGTLHLFELNFNRNPVSVKKLSSSKYHGHNFKRYLFIYDSEIYSAGGEGLFNTFSGILKFDRTLNEWLLLRLSGFPKMSSKINAAWLNGDSLNVILTIPSNNSESYLYGKIDLKTRTYLNIRKLENLNRADVERIGGYVVHESQHFLILQIRLETKCRYILFNKETREEISTTFFKEVPCIDGKSAVYAKNDFIYYRDSNGNLDSVQLSENIIYQKKGLIQNEESSDTKINYWMLSIVLFTILVIAFFKSLKTKLLTSLAKYSFPNTSSEHDELISELEQLLLASRGATLVGASMDEILKISQYASDTIRAKRSAYIKAINKRGVLRIIRVRSEKDKRYFEYKIE